MPLPPGFTTVEIRRQTLPRLRELRRRFAADQNRDLRMADVIEALINEYGNQNEHENAESAV